MSMDAIVGRLSRRVLLVASLALLVPAGSAFAQTGLENAMNATFNSLYAPCPDGTIVNLTIGQTCPPSSYTGPVKETGSVRGNYVSTSVTQTTVTCPKGSFVSYVWRHSDPFNTYTRGVRPVCQDFSTGLQSAGPTIGQWVYGAVSQWSGCGSDQVMAGIYGRAGNVIDGFGAMCKLRPSAPEFGPQGDATFANYVGGYGGAAQGPFNCPNYGGWPTYPFALVGTAAPYYGGYNVIQFWAQCARASYIINPPNIYGSAPTGTTRKYRASGSRGPVRFTLQTSKAVNKRSSWYYGIRHLVVATGCSGAARVPGAIVVSDRRRASQHPHFGARLRGFRVSGHVFGPLGKPEVRAKVKVLKGACRGDVLRFTARPRR